MIKKTWLALLAAGMCICSSLNGNAQAIVLLRDVIAPVEDMMISNGFYLNVYDLRVAPNKPKSEMMSLKGNPKKMVQKVVVNQYFGCKDKGTYPDTVYYTPEGNIARLCIPAIKASGMETGPERVEISYFADGKINSMYRFSRSQFADGFKDRKDITRYEYNNKGDLVKEVFNMYMLEAGNWEQQSSFIDQVDMSYDYNAEGILESAHEQIFEGLLYYNKNGLLSKISRNGYSPDYVYTYDANDRLATFSAMVEEDGMDETDYYKLDVKITRNENGEIVSCVRTQHTCNSKWVITRKGTPKTYKVAYTHDAQGNWTKATITRGQIVMATITRTFTY